MALVKRLKTKKMLVSKNGKSTSDSNQIYDDWDDLIEIENTGKDAGKIRKKKSEGGTLEVFSTLSPRVGMGGSMNFLCSVFRNNVWRWTNLGIVYD